MFLSFCVCVMVCYFIVVNFQFLNFIAAPTRENHPRIPVSPKTLLSENQGATASEQPQLLTPDTLNKSGNN